MIETERLYINPLEYNDLVNYIFDQCGSVLNDDDMIWAANNVLEPMQLEDKELHGYYTFWVATDKQGNWIGDIGLKGKPDMFGVVEVGYFVGEEKRLQGYATEMLGGFMDKLFEDDTIKVVTAQVEEWNEGSMKVLRNNGFTPLCCNKMITFITVF
jgi:RimJ/RimL family protein N-acetyltransferase